MSSNTSPTLTNIFKSDSFCVHPWTNLMVNSTGSYNFCCVAWEGVIKDKDGKILHASKDLPDEVWNANSIRKVRKAMLDGEKLDIDVLRWANENRTLDQKFIYKSRGR